MSEHPPRPATAVIACGALSKELGELAGGFDIHPLPPLLHNHPERIAAAVEGTLLRLREHYEHIVIGYAECGTAGALDAVGERHGVQRLPGLHCYDLAAGPEVIEYLSAEEPGTYFLTDFLIVGFERLVWRELGLDRYPELRSEYFRNYRRVVWLAQRRTPDLERAAERAADRLGLPLVVQDVSRDSGLTRAMDSVLAAGIS
jgi:hypothetical protein